MKHAKDASPVSSQTPPRPTNTLSKAISKPRQKASAHQMSQGEIFPFFSACFVSSEVVNPTTNIVNSQNQKCERL